MHKSEREWLNKAIILFDLVLNLITQLYWIFSHFLLCNDMTILLWLFFLLYFTVIFSYFILLTTNNRWLFKKPGSKRERERNRTIDSHSFPCFIYNIQAWIAWRQEPGAQMESCRESLIWAINCCIPGYTSAGSQSWKWNWDMNSAPCNMECSILRSLFTAALDYPLCNILIYIQLIQRVSTCVCRHTDIDYQQICMCGLMLALISLTQSTEATWDPWERTLTTQGCWCAKCWEEDKEASAPVCPSQDSR